MSSMGEMHYGKCRSRSFEHLTHARHKKSGDYHDSCRTTRLILLLVLDPGGHRCIEHSKNFIEPLSNLVGKRRRLENSKTGLNSTVYMQLMMWGSSTLSRPQEHSGAKYSEKHRRHKLQMGNRGQTLSDDICTVYVWTHLPAKTYEDILQKTY